MAVSVVAVSVGVSVVRVMALSQQSWLSIFSIVVVVGGGVITVFGEDTKAPSSLCVCVVVDKGSNDKGTVCNLNST